MKIEEAREIFEDIMEDTHGFMTWVCEPCATKHSLPKDRLDEDVIDSNSCCVKGCRNLSNYIFDIRWKEDIDG